MSQSKNCVIVYKASKVTFYGIKSRNETFQMIDTLEDRCFMTESDAKEVVKKIVNKSKWVGLKIMRVNR